MRITRVITKTGDKGQTGLVGGTRVSKASPRVEAYGEVDELNSVIGVLRAFLRESADTREGARLDAVLKVIQEQLFVVGADLATPPNQQGLRATAAMTTYLEQQAEEFGRDLEALREFILPAGDVVASLFHLARTICRRAERRVVELNEAEKGNEKAVVYLNRLSDFLFILGRFYNKNNAVREEVIDFKVIAERFRDESPSGKG